MLEDATADADGVAVFVIDSDTRLNSVNAWSRSPAPNAVRARMKCKAEPGGVLQPRPPDIQRAQYVATRDTITVRDIGSGEKITHAFISMNWLAIINAILLPLSFHIAAREIPPSPLNPPTLPPVLMPPLFSLPVCFSLSFSPSSSAIFAMSLHFLTIPYIVFKCPTELPAQRLSLAWRTSNSNGMRRSKT